mgnify:CR=1 FL=1|tara:strand:+ start:588889 stop:589710 length:822 start_codon:yes stop_codon:yes gene_type:complete
MASKRLVHVGKGPWGTNYLKTYKKFPVVIQVAERGTWQSLIDSRPDGVVICTPPSTHIEIARHALELGIPVMIEKPLALAFSEASVLGQYSSPILVNHLYLFSAKYQALKQAVQNKRIKTISTTGIGTRSHEGYSVLWDYGPHDISMILDLIGSVPDKVFATRQNVQDFTQYTIQLFFGSSLITTTTIGIGAARQRSVSVDFEGGKEFFVDSMDEDPGPLYNAIDTFLGVLEGRPDDRAGLKSALEVLGVIETCNQSIECGEPVFYKSRTPDT